MKYAFLLICVLVFIGLAMQYSAGGGHIEPFATKQFFRFLGGIVITIVAASISLQWWFSTAYVLYVVVFLLILAVEGLGVIGMGARRWLDCGFFHLQPSELMRVCLSLSLARYFHLLPSQEISRFSSLVLPLVLLALPVILVIRQPDLGTALLLVTSSVAIFFCAGVRIWKFIAVGASVCVMSPFFWSLLHEYQKKRILIFLNPESDPLNAGYHIIQSKIALGSGGVFGKGFLKGSQAHLDFLPEKQTDFVFSMLCEEFGLAGGLFLIFLFTLLLGYNFFVAYHSKSVFARLSAIGLNMTLFSYIFVNIGMVCGLLPIVGIPLPFISYGGTSLITLLLSQGIIFACVRDIKRRAGRKGMGR